MSDLNIAYKNKVLKKITGVMKIIPRLFDLSKKI
jgi:hypothetical protein